MLRLDRLRPRLGRGHHTPEARAGQPSVTAHEDPELAKAMARDARDNEVLAVILAATLSADAHVIDVGAHTTPGQ